MSRLIDRAILMQSDELRMLLVGSGVEGLLVPGGAQECLDEKDAAQTLVCLTRDGLLSYCFDGLLDYADDLRAVLRVMRDCTDELVLWTAASPSYLCIYMEQDLGRAVVLRSDEKHPSGVRLSMGAALDLCSAALDEARASLTLPCDALQPLQWPWEELRGEGVLLAGRRFARGAELPDSLVLAMRTEEGDRLAEWRDGKTETLPMNARSLLPPERRER